MSNFKIYGCILDEAERQLQLEEEGPLVDYFEEISSDSNNEDELDLDEN